MHRPQSSRRRSSYSPQLCAAVAFLVLLFLSLTILQIRLSSSPHLPSSSSNQSSSSNSSSSSSSSSSSPLITDDRTDDLLLLDEPQKPEDTAPTLFWDHALAVARISFDAPLSTSPFRNRIPPPDLTFGSDDEPVDESVQAKLASIRQIEDVLLLENNSPMRDGWARWLETKADFIKRDRMLRSTNGEMLNPRNHFLLQDPDVAGFAGMSRGDRMMQKAVLKEMEEGGGGFLGVGSDLGFSEFVDRFFDGGDCLIRVFMVWNSPSWSFGVRHRRGVESLLHHHRNACVLLFSETVEHDFFKEFVKDG